MHITTNKDIDLLLRLERDIEVGERNYFSFHQHCYVFRYSICGKFKTVVIEVGKAAAELLKKYRKVEEVQYEKDGTVKMFTSSFIPTSAGPGSQFTQMKLMVPFKWEDAHFTQRETVEICTISEFFRSLNESGSSVVVGFKSIFEKVKDFTKRHYYALAA